MQKLIQRSYFKGGVKSTTVVTGEGRKLWGQGFVLRGEYEFETGEYIEEVEILRGVAVVDGVLFPSHLRGAPRGTSEKITIEAGRRFEFKARDLVEYRVTYHLQEG